MRYFAASLLTALLLHLHPLQAQDDDLLAASFDGFHDLFSGDHADKRYFYLTSDSNLVDLKWDFVESFIATCGFSQNGGHACVGHVSFGGYGCVINRAVVAVKYADIECIFAHARWEKRFDEFDL